MAEGRRLRDRDRHRGRRAAADPLSRAPGSRPRRRWRKAMARLHGAFALVVLFSGRHDIMIGARRGSPLAVGYGDGEMYLGSDALALAPFTKRICYLEEGDWVVLNATGATIFQGRAGGEARDQAERPLGRADRQGQYRALHDEGDPRAARGDRRHAAGLPQSRDAHGRRCRRCRSTSPRSRGSPSSPAARPSLPAWSPSTGSSSSRACRSRSTSPRSSATASRRCPRAASCIVISQSGETADTLAALRYAKARSRTSSRS